MKTNQKFISKHTPAPWRYNRINHFITAFKQNKEPVICEMARIPEFEANASLIAAAPELLEALKSADDLIGKLALGINTQSFEVGAYIKIALCSYQDEVQAAIRKAQGGEL